MATQAKGTKWSIEADYIQGCSCDYGCPCEFEAPPTKGFCEGIGAWQINKGTYGNVSLNGLGLGFSLRSPEAMHKGNLTMAVFIDQKANAQQRAALLDIASGKAGGLPFEIFPQLVTKLMEPRYVPFQFNIKGKNSSVKIGDAVSISTEPIKNPVTGGEENIKVSHETGFIFKEADVLSAKECRSSAGGELNFNWPSQNGFVSKIKYSN